MTLVRFDNGHNNALYINPVYVEAVIEQTDGTRIYMNGGTVYFVNERVHTVIRMLQDAE